MVKNNESTFGNEILPEKYQKNPMIPYAGEYYQDSPDSTRRNKESDMDNKNLKNQVTVYDRTMFM